jgi:hypothetical protein
LAKLLMLLQGLSCCNMSLDNHILISCEEWICPWPSLIRFSCSSFVPFLTCLTLVCCLRVVRHCAFLFTECQLVKRAAQSSSFPGGDLFTEGSAGQPYISGMGPLLLQVGRRCFLIQ